ncbi:hypothetical protein FQV39_10605 [Bosea sp. F3-2]|uniref:hypothetical protein n=1 Tax=Bosea sp. F3-2 TaxID=2599640 RepID=UPI0011EF5F92|nr:hypothetical protein [Bosea sp. F3-2]QEL22968.1 hypothetical protein FQV39_10605 [Bosea sp. F3-2]
MKMGAGDWVEVRSKDEILATLDKGGRLEGLPFMPQMFDYCGQKFQIYKRAHKTCDTVSGDYVGRRLPDSVHLNHRCDGAAYGGCQAGCLIFWKQAWLKPVEKDEFGETSDTKHLAAGCTEEDVLKATRASGSQPKQNIRYSCQATELLQYTQPLKWWDARQYVEDYTSGNNSLPRMLRGFLYFAFIYITMAKRRRLGRPGRWLYDRSQSLWGGVPFPRRAGDLTRGAIGPVSELNLQAGDWVRVRSFEDIRKTIDVFNQNRGMSFDAELVPYCGKVLQVKTRVETFIDEKTGFMRRLKTPAVILENSYCRSRYSENRLFCPRSIYTWWREIWLEKLDTINNGSELNK